MQSSTEKDYYKASIGVLGLVRLLRVTRRTPDLVPDAILSEISRTIKFIEPFLHIFPILIRFRGC